jgi:hypothetical protein
MDWVGLSVSVSVSVCVCVCVCVSHARQVVPCWDIVMYIYVCVYVVCICMCVCVCVCVCVLGGEGDFGRHARSGGEKSTRTYRNVFLTVHPFT